jgi:hypothetical protein
MSNSNLAGIINDNIRVEKFFIEADSFSSKTIAYLSLTHPQDESVTHYCINYTQDRLALLSNKGSLYTFNLTEVIKNGAVANEDVNNNKEIVVETTNENLVYEESKVTLQTKEFQFKSIPT